MDFLEHLSHPVTWYPEDKITPADTYKCGPAFAWLAPKPTATPGLRQCHEWTRCRDMVGTYFQGAVLGMRQHHGDIAWEGDLLSLRPCLDILALGVRIGRGDVAGGMNFGLEKLGKIIHPTEERLELERTQAFKLSGPPKSRARYWLFLADPFWLRAPPLLSLYLLLVRGTPYVRKEDSLAATLSGITESRFYSETGSKYVPLDQDGIKYILEKGKEAWPLEQKKYYALGGHYGQFHRKGLHEFSSLTEEEQEEFCAGSWRYSGYR